MNWHAIMHGAGMGCLLAIAGISLAMIADALVPNWTRILTVLRGNPARGFVPLSPTASVLLLRTSFPSLHAVEADAQPPISERAA
jgi:hypothetical protein